MRKNLPVTDVESPFPVGNILVSKTDLKGQITYANDAFIALSGFTREELLGQPHNLVRHPDLPAVVFEDMWATLKSGYPWRGLVKNRRKDCWRAPKTDHLRQSYRPNARKIEGLARSGREQDQAPRNARLARVPWRCRIA